EKCSGCHVEGGIAPFSLKSYATSKPFAKRMAAAVEAGTMPPFLAQETADCKPRFKWADDLRLSAEEKAKIRDWADHGAPEGDAASAAVVKPPPAIKLDKEDVKLVFPTAKIGGTRDLHSCAIVDPALLNDAYVTSRLITPANAKVLHHVVSYLIPPGKVNDPIFGELFARPRTKAELEALIKEQKGVGIGGSYDCFGGPALVAPLSFEMLDAWAPGGIPNQAPPNSGQPISKDALVLLDIHYHPTGGGEEIDEGTRLGLTITETPPKYVSRTVLLGNFQKPVEYPQGTGNLLKQPNETVAEFLIPPNVKDHVEENTWTWKLPLSAIKVFGMGTHMHYVGRDLRIWVDHKAPKEGEPASECLIQTPSWDFNWQRGYGYDATYETYPTLSDGDTMHFKCIYDNTMDNHFVARALEDQGKTAPVEVRLGEDTLDEMCLGALGIIYPNTAAPL
ncbi:MAG TPA: hypothetical protein VFX59_26450, partial [Polyangiales bacterium]|nr:hypothetical protein [Polyangiales bacterium]